MVRKLSLILLFLLGISLIAPPSNAITAGTRGQISAATYKSCSYPPSNGNAKEIVNARSWTEQGFTTTHVKGVDVSMWQHPKSAKYPKGKPINFAKLKSQYGISFAFLKGSDGGGRDRGRSKYWFKKDRKAAKAQGLVVGAYHYAVPGQLGTGKMIAAKGSDAAAKAAASASRRSDAKLQAKLAVTNALGNPKGDLPITLDFEERPCGWSWKQTAVWTKDFLLEVERLTGRKPMIYANGYFINKLVKVEVAGIDFSSYKLWVAMWGPKLGTTPKEVPIWKSEWTFWQFTSHGALKGVPVKRTDLNVFSGTLEDLNTLANS
ncbi:MAG: hypothetical protein F2839_00255 [Actinobacteria bacterium]|uniref:Unannotated protein n=1 Tax=freshwater metagenome TaxID=449393 RepID=A0A6J5YNX5_9ZZZZ|nr:hypothetical protein [Actinomycetota bacterium]